mgnify:CR=1 FL=1|tara:strand:- start:290 stop:751 length:462 start_codon:yes stop_codon:yes gene_type:complete
MKFLKIIFIFQFILLTSCGYKAINNIYDYKFAITDYELVGNSEINKKLEKNILRLVENDNASRFFKINISSNLIKNATSKDSSGDDSSYEIKIIVDLVITENDILIDKRKIQKQIDYNTLESKFELKQYENLLIKDLTDQINLNINNYLAIIE